MEFVVSSMVKGIIFLNFYSCLKISLTTGKTKSDKYLVLLQLCGNSKSALFRQTKSENEYDFNALLLPKEHVPTIIPSIYATGIVCLRYKYYYIPFILKNIKHLYTCYFISNCFVETGKTWDNVKGFGWLDMLPQFVETFWLQGQNLHEFLIFFAKRGDRNMQGAFLKLSNWSKKGRLEYWYSSNSAELISWFHKPPYSRRFWRIVVCKERMSTYPLRVV